jgi:Na+/H+ antiporter NhaD/arsenite permease-like protein
MNQHVVHVPVYSQSRVFVSNCHTSRKHPVFYDWMAPPATLPAVLIFAATYMVLAVGRLPGFRVDRTGAAIIGATLDVRYAWLTLAMSSTLAGNLTVLGSVANPIVLERGRHKVRISFWEYARVGVPRTILTIALGVFLLAKSPEAH